jgi:hypothetical protein
VRIDQARRHQSAAQVLDVIDVNDVIYHAGYPLGQLGCRAYPGDPFILREDGGVAQDLRPCPQATDVGHQTDSQR